MGLFGSISKAVNKVVHKVTPWNDKSEGVLGLNRITPWNDKTEGAFGIGKITPWNSDPSNVFGVLGDGAALAAIIYGGMAAAGATGTTPGAATPGAAATSTTTAARDLTINPTVTGGVLNANTGGGAMSSTAGGGGGFQSGLGSKLSGLFSGGGSSAAGGGSSAAGGGLIGFVKAHPIVTGMIAAGAIGGVGNYMAAREQAKAQERITDKQLAAKYSYGGSGVANAIARNLKQPSTQEAIQTTRDAMYKLQTDPNYRKGFITAASKFIDPTTAQTIEDFLNSNTSQAGLFSKGGY